MNSPQELLQRDAPELMRALALDRSTARLEIRILIGQAVGVGRAWLITHERESLSPEVVAGYEALLARRLAGEPIAYILGEKEFYGRTFKVTPDVLIPRPETELLVDLALNQCRAMESPKILDLGTGSGCIAITLALECPAARVTAVDISRSALEIARHNAASNAAVVEFIHGHWFAALAGRQFDMIVTNPPYIPADDPHLLQGDVRHEPVAALVAGSEGLADIREIAIEARRHLRLEGALLLEHGYNQAEAVRNLLIQAAYSKPESWRDLAGMERVTGAKMSE